MNLYYGIAVGVRLLFALAIGDKQGSAYLWHLLQELLGVKAEGADEEWDGLKKPETRLQPVHD